MAIPIANAGPNQPNVIYGDLVTLDGTASSDPDGDSITDWDWSQSDGTLATLDLTVPSQPTFTAESISEDLRFTLRVRANGEWSANDAVILTVSAPDTAPIANAGPNQNVPQLTLVTLDGSASYDPDGDTITTYTWAQTHGTTATLDLADPIRPTFTTTSTVEQLRFTLRVTANGLNSTLDPVLIDVTTVDNAPVANAGPNQTVNVNTIFSLSADASSDPDGDPIDGWEWLQTDGSTTPLDNPLISNVTGITNGIEEQLRYVLTVTANGLRSGRDAVLVDVIDPALKPTAIIDAGAGVDRNITVVPNTVVTLDSNDSTDPLGRLLTAEWSQTDGLTVTIDSPLERITTVTMPATPTEIRIILVVDNGFQLSDPEPVIIRVEAAAILPVAVCGIDQTVIYGSTVSIDATGSFDLTGNGPINSWTWDQTYGETVTLDVSDPERPTFTAPSSDTVIQLSLICSNGTDTGIADYININVNSTGVAPVKTFPVAIYDSASPTSLLSRPSDDPLLAKPHVDGALLRVFWHEANTADGVYYWEYIDRVIDQAQREGKTVDLAAGDAYQAPQWVLDLCVTFDYDFRGITRTVALPWDTNYLFYKDKFIRALGARYDNTSNLRMVYFTYSAMTNGMEFHWRVDETDYASAGYTKTKLIQASKDVLDSYIAAFTKTHIFMEMHTVFESADNVEQLFEHGYAQIGTRMGTAAWWGASRIAQNLGGQEQEAKTWPIMLDAMSRGCPGAVQFVGNFTDQTYRFDFGAGWTPEYAIRHELSFFRTHGFNFFETWSKDLRNESLIPYLDDTGLSIWVNIEKAISNWTTIPTNGV